MHGVSHAARPHSGPSELLHTQARSSPLSTYRALLPSEALSPVAAASGRSARTGLYPRPLSFH